MQDYTRLFWSLLLCAVLVACGQDPESGTDSQSARSSNTVTAAGQGYERLYSPGGDAADGGYLDAHIFELDNGLEVYLTENPEEPNFYAEIAVKAGSKHDPADATGLAHYLEHLLFKGNRQLGTLDYEAERPYLEQITDLYQQHFNETDPDARAEIYAEINRVAQQAAQFAIPNEIDKLYNGMGASGLNAHTWHEETVYKVGLPSNRLKQWARVESARFVDPVFRLFHTELETVYEEKNRSLDNKDRVLNYALNDILYKVHPYGQQPTIGTTEHLKNPSLIYIRDYFETYYVPNNMAIFISGDIDIDETIALISEEFGDWESKPVPEVGPWQEQPIEGAERSTVQYPGEEEVALAFRTVPNDHPDKETLMVLDMILDNRTAGLINLNLNQSQRVLSAGSSPQFLNDYGSQQLWGVPKQDQTLEQVEELLLEQIELIKRGEFEEWIIPAIINDFKTSQKRSLESNVARVTNMRQAFLADLEWEHHIAEIQRLEQVTKADVVDAANNYFGDDYVAIYRVDGEQDLPSVDKPPIDPVVIDPARQSDFAAQILSMPYEEIEPEYIEQGEDYRIAEYAEGVPFYYARNPLNDLFSLSINVEVGTETHDKLSLATALLDKSGTTDLSNADLQKEWYRLGSNFNVSAGENESSISISGLDEQFEATLALMLRVLQEPVAAEQTLTELKALVLKSREDQKQNPGAISQALFLYNRYGDESPMLEAPTSSEIMDTSVEELHALTRGLLDYKHTISYTGSLPLDEVLDILSENHVTAEELKDTPPYRFRNSRAIDESQIYVINRPSAQSQVRIEFPDGVRDEELSVPVSLFNGYFGSGMSSVVFQELREARALAYSAAALYSQGSRVGAENIVAGAIGSQTDKTADAIDAFVDLFDNMPRSAERFQETKNSLISRYRNSKVGFRSVIPTVRAWERQGLDSDPRPERFARLQSAELEVLLNFQEQHIADRPKLISIVGDLSRIDTESLSAHGTIAELEVDDVFVE